MSIEELPKEERRLRVPTPERPVYRKNPSTGVVVCYTGVRKGFTVVGNTEIGMPSGMPGHTNDHWRDFNDFQHWQPVRPTFEPCEPEYEQVELKLPFVRRWEGRVVVYFKLNRALFTGLQVQGYRPGEFSYDSKGFILANSTPVRITGPTRKQAEVQYPALYSWSNGDLWLYPSNSCGHCIEGEDHGSFDSDTDRHGLTLITEEWTNGRITVAAQPQGEWELPFAVSGHLGLLVAFQAINDRQFKAVYATGPDAGKVLQIDYPAAWNPTTIG